MATEAVDTRRPEEPMPQIKRTSEQVEGVRIILIGKFDGTKRAPDDIQRIFGALSVIEWLLGDDNGLTEWGLGISPDQLR